MEAVEVVEDEEVESWSCLQVSENTPFLFHCCGRHHFVKAQAGLLKEDYVDLEAPKVTKIKRYGYTPFVCLHENNNNNSFLFLLSPVSSAVSISFFFDCGTRT